MQGQPVILVAAGVALLNEAEEILLLQRPEGEWCLPGGHMEVGESLEETATRELSEETGLTAENLELLGIASGKDAFHQGRDTYYVTAIYRATATGSEIELSREHLGGRFFALDALPGFLSVSAQQVVAKLREIRESER